MSVKTYKWWNVVGKLLDWFRDNLEDQVPLRSSMRSDTIAMREVLDRLADQASYAMSLADVARDNLKKELQVYDGYMVQAKKFVEEQKENEAKRCIFLANRSAETIERLTTKVSELQVDADKYANSYYQKKSDLEKRNAALPHVEQQLILQTKTVDHDAVFDDATRSFDATVAQIDLAKRQGRNKVLLKTDPNQAIDKTIIDSLEKVRIEEIYNTLQNTTDTMLLNEQDKNLFIENDPVAGARALLAKNPHEIIVGDSLRFLIK